MIIILSFLYEKETRSIYQEYRRKMSADILLLLDDNVMHILEELDLSSAINLLCSCKSIYSKRKIFMYYIRDVKNYQGNLIATFLDSYVDMKATSVNILEIKNKNKASIVKAYNSMKIIAFYCDKNDSMFQKYKTNIYIVEMLCKAVCKEYKYKYRNPSANIYSLFWLHWYDININLVDICKIIYHVKNKKYRALMNTLEEIKFTDKKDGVMKTIDFIIRYVDLKEGSGIMLNTAIIYVLYKFLEENIAIIKNSKSLCEVIIEKAHEFKDNIIYELHHVPNYLKDHIINKFMNVANMLTC